MTEPTLETIIAAIRETTAKAMTEEWEADIDPDPEQHPHILSADGRCLVAVVGNAQVERAQWEARAAHIAACSPANMAKLLAHVDALETHNRILGESVDAITAQAEKAERERDEARESYRAIVSRGTTTIADLTVRLNNAEDYLSLAKRERDEARNGPRRLPDDVRDMINAITKERDTAIANSAAIKAQADEVAADLAKTQTVLTRKLEGAKAERDDAREGAATRLRRVVSECASAIGNGAVVSPDCSVDFMAHVPAEIAARVGRLTRERDEWRARAEWTSDTAADLRAKLTDYQHGTARLFTDSAMRAEVAAECAACAAIARHGSFAFDIDVWLKSTKKEMTAHVANAIADAIEARGRENDHGR